MFFDTFDLFDNFSDFAFSWELKQASSFGQIKYKKRNSS